MPTRRHSLMLSGLVAALMIHAGACAQNSPPSSIGTDITSAVELSPQQVEAVKANVAYWTAIINGENSKPADVERARDELVRPLNQPGGNRLISPNFRGTFASAALPAMEQTLRGKNVYRAINAIRVVSALGTDRAATTLLQNADSQLQSLWEIRLRSADGLRLLLRADALDFRKTNEIARKLRDASMREDNWLVLRNQLDALNQCDATTFAAGDRSQIRSLIGEAMTSAVQRASSASQVSGPMLLAMGSAVSALRVNIVRYSADDQRTIGATLGPALGKLLEWARANWDVIKKDSQSDAYALTLVASSEGLLQFFDPVLVQSARPTPTTEMRMAWEKSVKPTYETGVKAWQGVLVKSPYRP